MYTPRSFSSDADITTTNLDTEVSSEDLADVAQVLECRNLPARHSDNWARGR
jgi:hypothetical protein